MSHPSIIVVEDLTKFYGKTVGVRNVGFAVDHGEIFGFLGPNGAGKTTTIRLMLDLLRPTSGTISIFAQPIRNNSLEIRKRCGYLPGNFAAYGHMTGAEFLRFVANLRGISPAREQNLIERFQLSKEDLSHKVKHLSHGTRQKLGIVQAFFHQPELLILDEPTIGLDPLMQEEFYELLRESQAEGSTVFFSSHNLPEVEKVCHRVAIIREGGLVALETLEALKKKRFRKLRFTLHSTVENVSINDARLLRHQGLHYEFLIKGDAKAVLTRLAELPLDDFSFPEPDLEEVFMAYYRSQEND